MGGPANRLPTNKRIARGHKVPSNGKVSSSAHNIFPTPNSIKPHSFGKNNFLCFLMDVMTCNQLSAQA
jgi:hypothetical protein